MSDWSSDVCSSDLIYQGCEHWDRSLVDPDNRRPVYFAARTKSLGRLRKRPNVADLLETWRDGRIKQFVVARTLELRAQDPQLFAAGGYSGIEPQGGDGNRLVVVHRWLDDREIGRASWRERVC